MESGAWQEISVQWPCLDGVYCSMLPIEKILHNYAPLSCIITKFTRIYIQYITFD